MNRSDLRTIIAEKLSGAIPDRISAPERTTPPETPSIAGGVKKLIKPVANAYRKSSFNSIFGTRANDNGFESYDYNMSEISQAEDTEGYVSISFDKHIDTCLSSSFGVNGFDKKSVDYVNSRLFQLFGNTGVSTYRLVSKIVRDLVKYSNCYIVLVREEGRSRAKNYKYRGKTLEPIVGAFIADPPSVTVKRNRKGTPLKYKQVINANLRGGSSSGAGFARSTSATSRKTFKAEDVIHLTFSQKEGMAYGTPYIVPALEDIRSLRRIEEMVEMLIAGHLFPLYHYIVGTKGTDGSPGTPAEIDDVKLQVEEMPTEGSLVTSERHEIKAIGVEGKALEVKPYLEYFEKRVLATLRISEITIGRGNTANKNTAQSIDKILLDRCKLYQDVIGDQLTSSLVIQFMLDGGLPITPKTLPRFEFGTIDEEAVRAKQNHYLNLYQSHTISLGEFRRLSDIPEVTESEKKDFYLENVELKRSEEEGRIAKKYHVNNINVNNNNTKGKPSSAQKTTKSKTQPSNQSGTKVTKTKVTANFYDLQVNEVIAHARTILTDMPDQGYNKFFAESTVAHMLNSVITTAIDYDNGLNDNNQFDRDERMSIILEYTKDLMKDDLTSITDHLMNDRTSEASSCLDRLYLRTTDLSSRIVSDYIEEEKEDGI